VQVAGKSEWRADAKDEAPGTPHLEVTSVTTLAASCNECNPVRGSGHADPIDNRFVHIYRSNTYATERVRPRSQKGSAELMILALLEDRHATATRSASRSRSDRRAPSPFRHASLYPMLYRLERRGWIEGRWVEKAGERRRRFYRLTTEGRQVLRHQRSFWSEFVDALDLVAGIRPASPKRGT
jgi:DNA-binding PadR family transcriptional regulator